VSFVTTTADILSTSFDFTLELSCTFQSTNVPVMTSIETNDIHLYTNFYMSSSTLFYLSTVLLFMKLVGTLEFSANDDAATEVTKSDDIIPDCRSAVSTSVSGSVSHYFPVGSKNCFSVEPVLSMLKN
jgi:hypothetical protein